jgi:hypothetical protein
MALSNWDTLAFDIEGPSHFGSVVNHEQLVVSLYKNWLNVSRMTRSTTGPPWRREDHLHENHVATVNEGELSVGSWSIRARRGPQNGVYVIATSARWDGQGNALNKGFLVGCGVSGFTDPTEPYLALAIDLGVDPDTLMTGSQLGDDGNDVRSVVGFRLRGAGPELVTVAEVDVPEPEWVGVLPDSVNYLKGFVQEHLREHGADMWPELAEIPWDQAERCNQGDLFFEDALGAAATASAPGDAEDPLLIQALGNHDG